MTWHRGDRLSIIPEKDEALFERFYMPLDEHWLRNFKHIEDYDYSFAVYRGSPYKDVGKVLRQRKLKTIRQEGGPQRLTYDLWVNPFPGS